MPLLRDEGDARAQFVEREPRDLGATDLHAAVAGGVDAGDQPPERRLPRPGRPDDREAFAGFEFEGDPVQHRPSGGVGEPDGVGVDDVGRRLRRQLGAVGFHGGQPDDAREAGLPDLEFVPPGQEFR